MIGAGVVAQIGLGQHEDRDRAAVIGEGEVTLQPGRVEIGVERGGDEQRIDIGGDQLVAGILASGAAVQKALAIEHPHHERAVGAHQHPVANRDLAGGQALRQAQVERSGFGQGVEPVTVNGDDAGRGKHANLVDVELAQKIGRPAERFEIKGLGQDFSLV